METFDGRSGVRQGRRRKRALLVISDGQDNASRYTLDQLRRRLKESDVQLYRVGVGPRADRADARRLLRRHFVIAK